MFGSYDNTLIFIITLFAYLLHDLVTNKISSFIKFFIKENYSKAFRQSIYDFIKYSSIMLFQNILLNGKFNLSLVWFVENYSLILGYIIFAYLVKYLNINNIKTNNYRLILYDNIKVTMGFIVQSIFTTKYKFMNNISEIFGYIFYHLITKKILL
jgi:hypothetical protein